MTTDTMADTMTDTMADTMVDMMDITYNELERRKISLTDISHESISDEDMISITQYIRSNNSVEEITLLQCHRNDENESNQYILEIDVTQVLTEISMVN